MGFEATSVSRSNDSGPESGTEGGCHNSRDQQGLFCQFTSLFIVIIQYRLNIEFKLSFLLRSYKFFEI